MLFQTADLKSFMGVTATTFDPILDVITRGIDKSVKRYLGREAVETTVIGDGVTTEGWTGDRNTLLTLREYPIQTISTVVVNGQPFTPILPFAPGGIALSQSDTGGSIAGGQALYFRITAFGPLIQPSAAGGGLPAPNQESGSVGEFPIFVNAGTSTNSVKLTWTRVPNVVFYKVYVGTVVNGENQFFQVNPTGLWGGWSFPGTESFTLTSLSGGTTGTPAIGALITGGDFWVKDGGKWGQIQRDYGWDLPKASIGWSSAWWDQQGYNMNPAGLGGQPQRVRGPAQENIIVQYTAGYPTGSKDLDALQEAGIEWAVARYRLRDKLEFVRESVHDHHADFAVEMPEHVRLVLNLYKRSGDWQHAHTTARV
jgi:hypothetical protein